MCCTCNFLPVLCMVSRNDSMRSLQVKRNTYWYRTNIDTLHTDTHSLIFTSKYTHARTHTRTHTHARAHTHTNTHTHTHTYIYKHTCTHTHTCTHGHTQSTQGEKLFHTIHQFYTYWEANCWIVNWIPYHFGSYFTDLINTTSTFMGQATKWQNIILNMAKLHQL